MDAIPTTLGAMLDMGTTVIGWCVTTFPVNVFVAGGVIGVVMRIIKKAKGVA